MTTPAGVQAPPVTAPPAPPAPPAAATQPADARAGAAPRMATGFFYPRWVLLAAICYMLAALIGVGIHYYFTARVTCSLGMAQALCSLDLMPGWAQVGLILLGFVVTLFFASTYGRTLGPESDLAGAEGFERLVIGLTEYQRVRAISGFVSVLVLFGLIVEAFRGQLDGVTLALGLITFVACGRAATYRPRRPAMAARQGGGGVAGQAEHERELGRQSGFWNVARNTPPFSFIFRTRHH